jgi:hypothetical protein
MQCSGFLAFKDLPEQEEGEPAREGTAAAELLEALLTGKPIGTHASNGVYYDNDMRFYIGEIAYRLWQRSRGQIRSEREVSFAGQGWTVKGRFDASYIDGDTLHVIDLKYGWRLIDPRENWQLIGYALGELDRICSHRQWVPEKIKLTIEQPRPYHEDGPTRSVTLNLEQMVEYHNQITARLGQAVHGITALHTGSQCRYCPALTSCPAANSVLWETVETIMNEWKQDTLDNDEIARQLKIVERSKDILKIREQSLMDLATYRAKSGQNIPGYALQPVQGHRQWSSGASVEAILALTGKDVSEKTLMSPARAEKLGVSKAVIDAMTKRPSAGHKLVAVDANKLGEKYFGKS